VCILTDRFILLGPRAAGMRAVPHLPCHCSLSHHPAVVKKPPTLTFLQEDLSCLSPTSTQPKCSSDITLNFKPAQRNSYHKGKRSWVHTCWIFMNRAPALKKPGLSLVCFLSSLLPVYWLSAQGGSDLLPLPLSGCMIGIMFPNFSVR